MQRSRHNNYYSSYTWQPAPKLITDEMLELLKPGSVIVDLAASQGGNCTQTVRDELTVYKDVKVIGYTDLSIKAIITIKPTICNKPFSCLI